MIRQRNGAYCSCLGQTFQTEPPHLFILIGLQMYDRIPAFPGCLEHVRDVQLDHTPTGLIKLRPPT